jgi:tetratricopeptide (TPR) repeat protein
MRIESRRWPTIVGLSICVAVMAGEAPPAGAQTVRPTAGPTSQPTTKSPTLHGYELRFPKLPFARAANTSGERGQARPAAQPRPIQQAAAPQPAPGRANPPRNPGNVQAEVARFAPGPAPQGRAVTPAGGPTLLPANGQPTIGQPPTTASGPASNFAPRSSPVSPARPAPAPGQLDPLSPQSPADQVALSAHELAAGARTEADFTQVIETCRRARASQPSETVARYTDHLAAWALNRRGQLKAEAGQTSEAMLDFDDAIRLDPQCYRAVHNRGILLAQSGEFALAFDDFNRTIQASPQFAKAYSNRAALFVVAGELMPALADYARAIELDANLSVAHRGRGRVCHLLGRLDEAVAHYDAAVQLAPDDAFTLASRADLMTDLGRYREAAAEYDRAIRLDPRSAHACRGSAWLLATCPDDSVRDESLAVERARSAIELGSKDDSLNFDTLAAAEASAGDFAAAAKTIERAIALAAENERPAFRDRLALYQRGEPYRITPIRPVSQASFANRAGEAARK